MKLLGKSRDWPPDGAPKRAMDSLLRAYVSRPGNRECSEFDADLANAYIERNLNTASRSRYEQHLSECTPCRKNVVALFRLVERESRPSISMRADSRRGAKRIFGATSWPRWAMATVAVIVLAISLPLLLTRNANRVAQDRSQPAAESQAGDNIQAAGSPEMSAAAKAGQSALNTRPSAEATKPSDRRQVDAVSSNAAAPTQQPAGSGGDRAASNGKLEAKTEPKPTEQVQVAAGSQPVSEVAAGQAQQEKRSDKEGLLSSRQQQPSKDAAAAETKSSGDEQDRQNAKDKKQVAENAAAVPPPAAPSAKAGKMKRSPAIRALRDSSAESVRPTEKKLGNKRFSLKDDTWTDKDFDPDKDLPIVTVVRDSNVYNELLNTRAGLKPYLGGFPPAERAIIVYKGTVYKLIPQQ